jgi:hypothetical protein
MKGMIVAEVLMSSSHVVPILELQGLTLLVCIGLLALLLDFQVTLNMMNYRFYLLDDVGPKYHFLSWLDPIERCTASSFIQNLKWCHVQTLMVAIVV